MLVSSLAFAFGHLASGNLWLVAYDVAGVFVDSLIYSMIYYKTSNCVMSTLAHLLANAISIAALFLFVL
ncbi:type II CAAX prenyl endopeptidase Rce1 family protein [uncultured Dubosiella sp.]